MKNTISVYKRAGAMVLCLALLCGVIMSTMVFPAAAAPSSVSTFAADFGDLAKLVDNASYANGVYTSKETDTTINEWVNRRFGLYSSREGSKYWTLDHLGVNSESYDSGDGWSGDCKWSIVQSGYLQYATWGYNGKDVYGGQMVRKSQTLTVKAESGALALLKNFEASMVFNKANNSNLASVFISFHEKDPGKVNTSQGKQVISGNEMVIIGNANGGYKTAGDDGIILGHAGDASTTTNNITNHFDSNLDNNTDYRLTVRVVGTNLTATVAKADDNTVVYTGSTTIAEGEGYLSFGASNYKRWIKSVSVTELDDSGNAVAFGTNTPLPYNTFNFDPADMTKLYAYSGNYWSFTDNTSDNAVAYRNFVSDKFNTYYNNEANYYQTKGIGYKSVFDGQTNNFANFNTHLYGRYLQRNVTGHNGYQAMRLISSLVPKNADGENYCYKNLEASMVAYFENDDTNIIYGGAVIGFRQQTPGKFVNKYYGVSQEQGFVFVSRTGLTVAAGKDIVSGSKLANDMYNRNATETFSTPLPAKVPLDITVRVVNKEVTVKIVNKNSGATLYESATPVAIDYDTAGAVAFGVTSIGHDIGAISLMHLDDAGKPIDIDKQTKTEKSANSEKFQLSLNGITPYVNGKYVVEGEEYNHNYISLSKLPAVEAQLKTKLAFYFNHEGSAYGEVEPSGNPGGNAGSGNWILFFNQWLQRSGSQGAGERVRQVNSFVPRDKNGEPVQLKNFTAAFNYRFEAYEKGDGAMLIGMRQKQPGKFVNGYNKMNTEQALIAIAPESISVAGGTDITKEKYYVYGKLEETFETKLPQEVHVEITAIGKAVTVEIYNLGGTLLYNKEYTVNYTEKGYLAFGIGATSGNYGELTVTRLDDSGLPTDFTEIPWQDETFSDGIRRFFADFRNLADRVEEFSGGVYKPTAADDAVNAYISAKFALWYEREGKMYERAYLGQSSKDLDSDNYAGATYWTVGEAGYLTRSNDGNIGGEMMRKADILVPKTLSGKEVTLRNFEAEVVVHDAAHKKGAVALSFRNDTLAKIAQGYNNVYSDQQLVAIGVDKDNNTGVINGGGTEIGGSNKIGPYTTVTEKVDALKTVTDYKLTVRAVGTDITVKITSVDGATEYYSATKKAKIDRKGYIYLAVTNSERSIAKLTVTELDDVGNVIPFGSNTREDDKGPSWDTTPKSYTQSTNSTTSPVGEAFKDVYFHGMKDKKPVRITETLDKHWQLNDKGVLMRKDDLSESVTDNVSLIAFNYEGAKKQLANFDATFKLYIDDSQTGTFWVTARQADETNCGKVVETPGKTDYLKNQIAVGFSVGGKITIATGDGGNAVEIAGPSAGTPTGDYTLRVQLAGSQIAVYVNDVMRVSRTVTAMGDGYICFGYSGAELGLSYVQITKLDDNGTPVDMTTDYTGVTPLAPIDLPINALVSALKEKLPTQAEALKADGNVMSEVYWDISAVDLETEGEYTAIGYLKVTNGVRAEQKVCIGNYDRETTVKYNFNDASELDDFDVYFLPEAVTFNQPALFAKGTEGDPLYVANGSLLYRNAAWRRTRADREKGFELGGYQWKDTNSWSDYSSNFGIAVLKTRTYKNFIIDMDFTSTGRWTQIGFGAKGTADGVYGTQINGGYTFHVEYNSDKTGTANIIRYVESSGKHGNNPRAGSFYPTFVSGKHHYRIVVSDGYGYFFVDDNTEPFTVELGDNYDGGYIYLGLNETTSSIDSLKIIDLDAKEIEITKVKSAAPADMSIDRSKGEGIKSMPRSMVVEDSKGNEYSLVATWNNSDYRSYKNGTFDFTSSLMPYRNMKIADGLSQTIQVVNNINGDFDASVTKKYYFDHDNDLLDFSAYYSEQQTKAGFWNNYPESTDYWTAYDGELVKANAATDKWKISDGKLTNSYTASYGGYNGAIFCKGVSTLLLDDLNLINFKIDVDFTFGNNMWYSSVAVGVNDPTKFIARCNQGVNATTDGKDTSPKYNRENGAGVFCHLEQEGYINFRGGVDSAEGIQRHTEDLASSTFIADHLKQFKDGGSKPCKDTHHMTVTVVKGVVMFQVDNSDVYVTGLTESCIGGLVGLSAYGNTSTFDNFQITALDRAGNAVPLADAERGNSATPEPDTYPGWQPDATPWVFKWGSEYEE